MVANAADAHIQGGQEPTADFTALTDTQLISLEGACAMILSMEVVSASADTELRRVKRAAQMQRNGKPVKGNG